MSRRDYTGLTSLVFLLVSFLCLVLLAVVPPPVPGAVPIQPLPLISTQGER